MPYGTLEDAWSANGFEDIVARLKELRDNFQAGGDDFRILMPQSEKPLNRLKSWSSWLKQYGQFLSGEVSGTLSDADRIRRYVLEQYIESARDEERSIVDVLVSDVNKALGLNQAWPNICQALAGKKFQDLADVPPPKRIGADQSSATVFRFDLGGLGIDLSELEKLRVRFLEHSPDFVNFIMPGDGWAKGEKSYKLDAADRVRQVIETHSTKREIGKSVFEVLRTAANESPLARWQTEDKIIKETPELLDSFYEVIGVLVTSQEPVEPLLRQSFHDLAGLKAQGATSLTYGERINIVFSALAMVRPSEAAPLKITRINDAFDRLTGSKLFNETTSDTVRDYRNLSEVFSSIFKIMQDDWGWEPQDWLDIQGFLWIACTPLEGTTSEHQNSTSDRVSTMTHSPTNLILYGPPGTGKTYSTAYEAVRLSIGDDAVTPPEGDRASVMSRYKELVEAGRIVFVTFHQSLSYEDFVEGLRPTTGSGATDGQDEPGGSAVGFSLRVRDGVFKGISERARLDETGSGEGRRLDRSRRVFKVALGRRQVDEDRIQYGLNNDVIHLGWGGDLDWSDERFDHFDEILSEWREKVDPSATSFDGNVVITYSLRADAQTGDYVVLSDGRDRLRAVGELIGEYYFAPDAEFHPHRRKVRWLWKDDAGVERSRFYPNGFRQHSVYKLDQKLIDWDALDEIVFGTDFDELGANARSYVLVIDEINRANISKVFGELITLLEPDKRIGAENEIRLKLPYSGKPFGVPRNLHIIGTMNTADRSIALLDTALRRRFSFRELMPEPDLLSADLDGIDLQRLLGTLNERIEYLFDREHQIGHAYFFGCQSRADIAEVLRFKVIPLLSEYFYEDWSKVDAVLGAGKFLMKHELKPPLGLEIDDLSEPKHSWRVLDEFDLSEFEVS